MKTKIILLLCASGAIGILSLAMAIHNADARSEAKFNRELQRFMDSSAPVIAWLKTEKGKTGIYPNDLPEDYAALLKSLPYQTRYYTREDGIAFIITIGDYQDNLFELFFDSETKEWTLDR